MNRFDGWNDELYHHGIKGQKWGLRRFQNEDGTLTAEGEARYGVGGTATASERVKYLNKLERSRARAIARQQETKNVRKKEIHKETQLVHEKTIKHIIESAKKDGQLINSRNVTRNVHTGKGIAKVILANEGRALLSLGLQTAGAGMMANASRTWNYNSAGYKAGAGLHAIGGGIGSSVAAGLAIGGGLAMTNKKVAGRKYSIGDNRRR